jgi:hypothetical protein
MQQSGGKFSRRKLLIAGGLAAATAAIVAKPLARIIAPRHGSTLVRARVQPLSLASAGYDDWLAQVGSTFAIGPGVRIALTGVRSLASGGARPASLGRGTAFLAVFDPIGGATLAGDLIYIAIHPTLGAVTIFLSASPDPATPARMLAVFN